MFELNWFHVVGRQDSTFWLTRFSVMGATGQVTVRGKGRDQENQSDLCQLSSHLYPVGFKLDVQPPLEGFGR